MPIWHHKITEQIERRVANPAITTLLRRWRDHPREPGRRVPAAQAFALDALHDELAELAPDLMLLEQTEGADWTYRHYGNAIARQAGFDMSGRRVSSFGGEIAEFFLACYEESRQRGEPMYTVHYADRARNVFTWERLLLPLADAAGNAWLLVYNRPLQSRLDLQQQVLNASDDAILALQAVRDDAGRHQDWLVLMLNDAMAGLVGLARPAAAGQRVGEVLLRWADLGLDAVCRTVTGAERAMPGLVHGDEREIELTVAGQPRLFAATIRPLRHGAATAGSELLGDGCVLRLVDLAERRDSARALREARAALAQEQQLRQQSQRRWHERVRGLQQALETGDAPALDLLDTVRELAQELGELPAAARPDGPIDPPASDPAAGLEPGNPIGATALGDGRRSGVAQAVPSAPDMAPGVPTQLRGPIVLVAEDDPVNQLVLRRQLELLGCCVHLAEEGQQALEAWEQLIDAGTPPALVLSDVHMPVLDGHAFARALRQRETARLRERTPLLAIGANAEPQDLQLAHSAGMDGVLAKPVQLVELRQVLARWVPAPAPMEPATAASDEEHTVLDLEVLRRLLGHDEAAVRELLADYQHSAAHLADELRRAFRVGDAPVLAAIAHKLKSASTAVGALPLARLCAQLERRPWTGDDPAAVSAGLAAFDAAVAAVTSRIESYLRPRA